MSTDTTPTRAERTLLGAVNRCLVWRSVLTGRAYSGSGRAGKMPPEITGEVDVLIAAGWIEKRSPTSAVYRLTESGREALYRA